jgi:L-ascorbate metabolism protein UlaG (beta-lactamase superfamily)
MGRFDDRATPVKGPGAFLRWKLWERFSPARRADARPRGAFHPPARPADTAALLGPEPSLTWIGHATFAVRTGGLLWATDPIFGRVAGALRRLAPPGIPLVALPRVDVITVSHNHMDHMDLPTLRRIGGDALVVVPLGNAATLRRAGLSRVVELDWWQAHREGDVEVTLVPARHWSMRAPWNRNQALWGGFVVRSRDGVVYHAGDTAYFDGFAEIGARVGPIDWALLPIGAYEPSWFMKSQHMNPEEAGQAFLDLGARTLVAMHWGTFLLTDEPPGEPPQRLRDFFRGRGLDEERLWILDVGENRRLGKLTPP